MSLQLGCGFAPRLVMGVRSKLPRAGRVGHCLAMLHGYVSKLKVLRQAVSEHSGVPTLRCTQQSLADLPSWEILAACSFSRQGEM